MSDRLCIEVRDITKIYRMGDKAIEYLVMGVNLPATVAHCSALSRKATARAVQ